MFQLHKSIGFLILALTLVRIVWRLTHRPPAQPAAMKRWEVFAAHATHAAFYALMLTPALALYFALGFGALDNGLGRLGGTPARAVLYGWLATFFGCVYLSFAP